MVGMHCAPSQCVRKTLETRSHARGEARSIETVVFGRFVSGHAVVAAASTVCVMACVESRSQSALC